MNTRQLVLDFLIGGALVAGALLVAGTVNPAVGGVLAGAPIRTGVAVGLHYFHTHDSTAATEMARGVLTAMLANVCFATVLYLAIPRVGFGWGFIGAAAAFVLVVGVISLATGEIR